MLLDSTIGDNGFKAVNNSSCAEGFIHKVVDQWFLENTIDARGFVIKYLARMFLVNFSCSEGFVNKVVDNSSCAEGLVDKVVDLLHAKVVHHQQVLLLSTRPLVNFFLKNLSIDKRSKYLG